MPNIREGKILGGTIVLKTFAIATALVLTMSGFAEAQTPRKGGTIRLTAPYGSSFANLDIHTSNRAQDEIYAKAIHRTLYNLGFRRQQARAGAGNGCSPSRPTGWSIRTSSARMRFSITAAR